MTATETWVGLLTSPTHVPHFRLVQTFQLHHLSQSPSLRVQEGRKVIPVTSGISTFPGKLPSHPCRPRASPRGSPSRGCAWWKASLRASDPNLSSASRP